MTLHKGYIFPFYLPYTGLYSRFCTKSVTFEYHSIAGFIRYSGNAGLETGVMAEGKRPRWESEMWNTQGVSDNIVCKTCIFRFVEVKGQQEEMPDASTCEMYEYPDSKPNEVYFDGAECDYYEKQE